MRIRLFHYPATRSARILWLLHELAPAVEAEVVRLDLYRGEQYRPDFADRFPLHAVPAVEIETGAGAPIAMTESGAIVAALADAFPEKGLAPAAAPLSAERADYLRTIHACGASFDMFLWQIRIHEHVLDPDERDERTAARYRRKFSDEVAPTLARRLSESEYVCGDRFTAADCMVGHAVMWARSYGLCDDPPTRDYLSRLSKRPAFRLAFADSGEFDPVPPRRPGIPSLFTG